MSGAEVKIKERIALYFAWREVCKQVEGWLEGALHRPLSRKEKSMLNALLGNWKTSVAGIVLGAFQLHQGGMTWQNALMAALMATLGFVAKDGSTGSKAVQ